jgi:hypothetical protein
MQGKKQNVLHLACSRTGSNNTAILRAILAVAPKDARLQRDSVNFLNIHQKRLNIDSIDTKRLNRF